LLAGREERIPLRDERSKSSVGQRFRDGGREKKPVASVCVCVCACVCVCVCAACVLGCREWRLGGTEERRVNASAPEVVRA